MTDAAITLAGVNKSFGEKRAVRDLDLEVPIGSVCGFLGPNGAGKTTTIRMVMSIIYPDSGEISVLGRKSAAESKDRIGYLPEERGVYRKMRVHEFLTFIGRLKGVSDAELKVRIDEWLEKVELAETRKKRCEELSKGMQQKIQFLAAIIHDPDLIILDEPFSGLDPVNARLLRSLIDELSAEGKTVIFSTHVLQSAEQICDRVFMINRGRKVLDGPIDAIRSKFDPKTILIEPAHDAPSFLPTLQNMSGVHSANFLGDDMRLIEAHVDGGVDADAIMRDAVQATSIRRMELRRATLEDIFVSLVDASDSEDSIRAAISAEASNMEVTSDA